MSKKATVEAAEKILVELGLPRSQQNERSALCLLALLNLPPDRRWSQAESPLLGITPIMNWVARNWGRQFAPNTRETFRRQTMHQFMRAGLVLYNPDDPKRAVNSPKAVYQIAPAALALLRTFGSAQWQMNFGAYIAQAETLAQQYAMEREDNRIPLQIAPGKAMTLSAGQHSELIRRIVEDFGPRFVPGCVLLYVGDTGEKWGYFNEAGLTAIGIDTNDHGKMPDVIIHDPQRDWLLLIESVTSHGPVDGKRHDELAQRFANAKSGLVYVTAFPDRKTMARYLARISWETEVWCADAPSHLIHFNGVRFLGPYRDDS